jgi:diguanylate cyclase (GGDEF)-like protein
MTPVGPIQVTVSIGVAQVTDYDLTPDPLLSRADHALYAAKAAGRNRVELFRLPRLPSAHT